LHVIGKTDDMFRLKDWTTDGTARCERGHKLKWERGLYRQSPCDPPF
jgi:hypothetical protein